MAKKKRLKGDAMNIAEMNLAIYGSMDPDMPSFATQADRDRFLKDWKAAIPKFDGSRNIGVPMIFGTGGTIDSGKGFEDIFKNPEKYRR